jgi:hypothetical protein
MSVVVPVLVFAAVASPAAFKTTSRVLGKWIASQDGAATIPGLLLHGIVFVFLWSLVEMLFARSSGYTTEGGMKFMSRDDQDDENNAHYQQDRFVFSGSV